MYNIKLTSILKCPVCSHSKEEIMSETSCLRFYECENCHTLLKPKSGDCCVFCSFGSVKCPPVQKNNSCKS